MTRFFTYLVNILSFRFGLSFRTGWSVIHDIFGTGVLQNTLVLVGTATLVSFVSGVGIGTLSVIERRRWFGGPTVAFSMGASLVPVFWLGPLLIGILSLQLHLFPAGGSEPYDWIRGVPSAQEQVVTRLQYGTLPFLALTLPLIGMQALAMRRSLISQLNEARTGSSEPCLRMKAVSKEVFGRSLLPMVVNMPGVFTVALGAVVIVESIFGLSGLGTAIITSLNYADLPVIQASFFIIGLLPIAVKFVCETLLWFLDPTLRQRKPTSGRNLWVRKKPRWKLPAKKMIPQGATLVDMLFLWAMTSWIALIGFVMEGQYFAANNLFQIWYFSAIVPVFPATGLLAGLAGLMTRDRLLSFSLGLLPGMTQLLILSHFLDWNPLIWIAEGSYALIAVLLSGIAFGLVGLGCNLRASPFHTVGKMRIEEAKISGLVIFAGLVLWIVSVWVWPGWWIFPITRT